MQTVLESSRKPKLYHLRSVESVAKFLNMCRDRWESMPIQHRLPYSNVRGLDMATKIISDEHYAGFGAEDSHGMAVACVFGFWHVHPFAEARIANMLAVVTHPERGASIRTLVRLCEMFEDWAREQDCAIIGAGPSVGMHIDAVASMFERMGYTQIGVQLEKDLIDG